MSEIDSKYAELGGPGGWLGPPVDTGAGSDEMDTADGRGRARDYANGTIVWSEATGAHEVHGDIRLKWAQCHGERELGFPLTDELGTPNGRGRYSHFEHGSIYWTEKKGAHDVHGAIRDKWAEMDWENSWLGFPTSDQRTSGRTIYNEFEGGSILHTPAGVEVRKRID